MTTTESPWLLYPFPQAILHVDANAFFTSVEQALNPSLKGKPVVTGKERGIIACASYEAKALGIRRGVSLREAKARCPGLVVLPSDYETYSLFSKRMFDVIRRFTPVVEEASVDEAFADLSGVRRLFRTSYEDLAGRIRAGIRSDLDITVSVGLSVTKSLAKLASGFRKPDALTVVPGTGIHEFLKKIPIGDVWGIGPQGVRLLAPYGVRTAYDWGRLEEGWISERFGKPGREIWSELRGTAVWPVRTEVRAPEASISKTKTFSAPSRDRDYVYARLVRNVESAFIKLRRHRLRTRGLGLMLRHNTYEEEGLEARLNRPTSSTHEVLPWVRVLFDGLYRPGAEYRSVMVFLAPIEAEGSEQLDLFEDRLRIERLQRASRAIDAIHARFGKHSVALGSGLFLSRAAPTAKDEPPRRKQALLPGETARQRLSIPRMQVTV